MTAPRLKRQCRTSYPPNWRQLGHQCKERAGWHCEQCGVAHGTLRFSKAGHLYIVYLAAAHLNHDPSNPNALLCALCQRCHLQYDAPYHAQVRKARTLRRSLKIPRRTIAPPAR